VANKVYFVRHHEDYEGLYIGAPSRGKAKEIGWHEIGCDWVNLRTEVIKGKETDKTGILVKRDLYALDIYSPEVEY
jgi:hypothetical protein